MKQPELGKVISELRHKKRLTQAELAANTRIGLRTVQRIENASVEPRVQTLKILFDYLEYDHNTISKNELTENKDALSYDKKGKYAVFDNAPVKVLGAAIVLIILVFGIYFSGSPNSKKLNTSELIGTWELVMFDHGNGLQVVRSNKEKRVKTITEDHFMWVNFNDEEKEVNTSAGGTYALDGDMYIERINYGSSFMKSYIETESRFTWKIEDEMLKIEGKLSSGLKITEVWKRVSNID